MGFRAFNCPVCDNQFGSQYDGQVWCQCITAFCSLDCAMTSYNEDVELSDEEMEHVLETSEVESCIYCREEDAPDKDLLEFLLEHFKLEREDAVKLYYKGQNGS